MSEQTDSLVPLLTAYGLSTEESRVYLLLLHQGWTSALSLSRTLAIGRTKVYRLLDILQQKKLIEVRVDQHGMKFGAAHPSTFQQVVSVQEQQVQAIKQSLPSLVSHLSTLLPRTTTQSKVLYYEGVEGLQQVSYNITKAKDRVRVFEMEHLSDFVPKEFAEMVREKLVEGKIMTHDITNKQSFPGFTDVQEMIKNYSEFRSIAPEKLTIQFEVLIYNDVYATYTYQDNTIFCVEIYNNQLAQMQKQIFDFIWTQAKPMHFTDERGAAVIQ